MSTQEICFGMLISIGVLTLVSGELAFLNFIFGLLIKRRSGRVIR